jgi:hypothetical protein
VFSRRALGIYALSAVILAAISFAVVDVSIADANGCIGVSGPCADSAMPLAATAFAIVGIIALLVSVVLALKWISGAIHPHHDADVGSMLAVSTPYDEDEQ